MRRAQGPTKAADQVFTGYTDLPGWPSRPPRLPCGSIRPSAGQGGHDLFGVGAFFQQHDRCSAWWVAVAEYLHTAPGIVRELLLSRSVLGDPIEAEHAIAWGRAHPAWTDEPTPLYALDPERDTVR